MSQLQLSLLGTPEVKHGERTLTFCTRKALALLVYLSVEGGTHPRKTLSEAFWPELDAEHGRAALQATLLELRKLLERTHGPGEPAHLLIERDMFAFDQGSPLILDLRLVESAGKQVGRGVEPQAGQAREARLAQLEQATRLARGPFLAGFTLRDSQFFDDWTRQQREYWHLRVHQLFAALSRLYERVGDGERALETVSRWLGFDPLQEEGYRRLMRLRFSSGDRVGALQAYTTCREVLTDELELEPEPETVALATWIRHTAPVRCVPSPSPHCSPGQPPATLLNGPYLGRSAQFGSLIECYQRVHAGQAQLVLLQGETGMGKTRLASAFLGWAQAQGAQVLMGKALQTGRPLPYQPLIAVLRQHLEQEPAPDELVSAVWLAELARLLPELREHSANLTVPTTDETLGHSGLLEATARLLQAWAARRPLVLVLEDLHWADTETLDLVLYLAESLADRPAPILLLLTLRTEAQTFPDPHASWVMTLKRTGLALTALTLAPFTPEETLRFVQALAWVEQPPQGEQHRAADQCPQSEGSSPFREPLASLAHWLYVQAHGQPLYLTELLKGLLEQEIVVPSLQQDGTWGLVLRSGLLAQTPTRALIPARVRELIRFQLGQLTPSAWSLLVAGAVMGEGLTFQRLCQVAQLEEETGVQALEELLRRGWLCESHPAAHSPAEGGYTFPGEMIREVVSQEAGTSRQRLVQRRVWAVLQEEAEQNQSEEVSLPPPASLDGHAPAATRTRPPRPSAAGAVSRERSGLRLAATTDAAGAPRRQAEAGRGKKARLVAWEQGAAAQAIFAFPRSPPGSPASAFLRRTKGGRVAYFESRSASHARTPGEV
jgi:DNA-binding SARP family transcriptional activator/energy-coupling factor transporter ATP-binding protein EcfA2